ncbi:hypothetical protein PKHYL_40490 [Psychrobacter sp. KH172YL61]|nr:hypothetical protein PKHYL_40490 [Psychrobacter sp. KH172YL61]
MRGLDRFEIRRGRIDLRKGKTYLNKSDNKHYELVEYLNESTEVVVRSVETGKTSIVNIQSLLNIKDQNNDHINVDISAIGDEEWQKHSLSLRQSNLLSILSIAITIEN